MKARDIMTHPVTTVHENCTLEDAAHTMLDLKIGCLPVTDSQGKLSGILTESDFAAKERGIPFSLYRYPQVLGEWLPKQGVEAMYAAARTRQVGEFMSRNVACTAPDDEVEDVIAKMLKTRFHRLPVVEDGVPVGIVTRRNLLRLMVPPDRSNG